MAEIFDFLKGNRIEQETTKKISLPSFKAPFVITTITEAENTSIKKNAMVPTTRRGGKGPKELNTDKYGDLLVARCVTQPDLTNAELQASYGTDGSEIDTLKAMLLAGEYATLTKEIIDFNGFNDDDFEELTEEVKN